MKPRCWLGILPQEVAEVNVEKPQRPSLQHNVHKEVHKIPCLDPRLGNSQEADGLTLAVGPPAEDTPRQKWLRSSGRELRRALTLLCDANVLQVTIAKAEDLNSQES